MSEPTPAPAPSTLTPATTGASIRPGGEHAAQEADRCGSRHHHHHHRRGGFMRGLFAGALLIGVIAGASYIGSSYAHPGMRGGPGMLHGSFDPETAAKRIDAMVSFALADVDASAEQKAGIGAIAKSALQDLMPLRDQHKAARTKAVELLSAATIDRAAMEQVRAAELKLAETASRRITQAMADAAETLQPAQRAKLAEKMKQRMERRG